MSVWLKPCPMCSVPVTLGGGSRMQKASGFDVSRPASKYARDSHSGYQRRSMSAGSKLLASSMVFLASAREGKARIIADGRAVPGAACPALRRRWKRGCDELQSLAG